MSTELPTNNNRILKVQQSYEFDGDSKTAFSLLLSPNEQLKWNPIYISAEIDNTTPIGVNGEPVNGTMVKGNFKGSGKMILVYQDILQDEEFTHYAGDLFFGGFRLADFKHRYQVLDLDNGKVKFTQTMTLHCTLFGWLVRFIIQYDLKRAIEEGANALEKRLKTFNQS